MVTATATEPFVLEALDSTSGPSKWHAISPILIGLTAPFAFFVLVNPGNHRGMLALIILLMIAVGIVAAAIFIHSVMRPGVISAFAFDAGARRLELIRSGSFANTITHIAFGEISSVGLVTRYDDDGYKSVAPMMTLASGEQINLPPTTTAAELRHVRELIGR